MSRGCVCGLDRAPERVSSWRAHSAVARKTACVGGECGGREGGRRFFGAGEATIAPPKEHSREWLGPPRMRPPRPTAAGACLSLREGPRCVRAREARPSAPSARRHTPHCRGLHARTHHARVLCRSGRGSASVQAPKERGSARGTSLCPAASAGHRRGLSRAPPHPGARAPGPCGRWSRGALLASSCAARMRAAAGPLPASPWGACWR